MSLPLFLLQLFTACKFRASFPLKQIPGILCKRFFGKGSIPRICLCAAFYPVFPLHPLFMVFPFFLRLPVSVPPVVIFRIRLFLLHFLRLAEIVLPGKSIISLDKTKFFFLSQLCIGLLDFLSKSFLMRLHTLFRPPFPGCTMPRLPGIGIPRLIGSIAAVCKSTASFLTELCISFFTAGAILFFLLFLFCH